MRRLSFIAVIATLVAVSSIGFTLVGQSVSAGQAGIGEARQCAQTMRFVNGSTAGSETLSISLQPGEYKLEIFSSDAYEGRTNSDPALQQGERVRVFHITTSDLADGVESAEGYATGNIMITEPTSSVLATHVHANGYDSVQANVCFTLIPPPPPETTLPPPVICVGANGEEFEVRPGGECPLPPAPTTTAPPPPPTTAPPATQPPLPPEEEEEINEFMEEHKS